MRTVGTSTNGSPIAMMKNRAALSCMKFAVMITPTVSAALTAMNSQPCQVLGVAP